MPHPPMLRPPTPKAEAAAHDQLAVRRTTLPGGLRVVTEYVPSVRSASVGVWVGIGSRDEGPSVAGAAHFAVEASTAVALIRALRGRLPGYLVPRLVREESGAHGKVCLAC